MAAAAEWAIWGMGSTVATVAALWCAIVDTGTLIIWSLAGVATCGRYRLTARGDWRGHDWDVDVREGGVVGRGDVICGVHCGVKWLEVGLDGCLVNCSDEGSCPSFLCARAVGDLWPQLHLTELGKKA
jgi:hypothetical protein